MHGMVHINFWRISSYLIWNKSLEQLGSDITRIMKSDIYLVWAACMRKDRQMDELDFTVIDAYYILCQ